MGSEVEPSSSVLAGRYRIVRVVAQGGIGTVYEAVDQTTGRTLALKRLNADLRGRARVRVLFELEFHTLARLSHPRIIAVYESGIDGELPFYTMELLPGRDLRELVPIAPAQAASDLRDVASALALLHTRRLLHRDPSPRNVRRTEDGHCKLLDFGTMALFGVPETMAGTPPLVPPEALQGTALDQRADLYALGALAYYLLTGKHAYPARNLRDLPERWEKRPPSPRKLVTAIPAALDDLVMGLLQLDRMRRPASAAEVIDALQSLFALPALEESELERSYFLHTPVIGRQAALSELADRMDRLATGAGSVLLLQGPASIGRSRMLDEASLLAQTRGLLSVRVGALDHRSQRGVARAVARGLHAAAPAAATQALGPNAAEVLPLLRSSGSTLRYGGEAGGPLPGEARARLQRALTEWLLAVSHVRPLVLLIDDVVRCDEFSLSLFAALAHEAREHPLLLVTTRRDDDARPDPPNLAPLQQFGTTQLLPPLDLAQVRALVGSLFGATVSDVQLGDYLYRHSGGNPGLCLELSRHLVDTDALRYADGQWTLTATELGARELGSGIAQALAARVHALDPDARTLAVLAALHHGPIPIHVWLQASGLSEARFFQALTRLSREAVVVSAGDDYSLSQEAMRTLLRERTEPGERAALHLSLASVLAKAEHADDDLNQLAIGWHLLGGGRQRQGAELLAEVAPRLLRELTAMDVAIPALETALEILERTGAPPRLTLQVRGALGRAAYTFDHELERRHGMRTLALLHEEVGLGLGDKLRPFLGAILSVRIGFVWSFLRGLFRPARGKGPSLLASIVHYTSTLVATMGVRVTALDPAGVAELLPYVESLRGFLGRHAARAAYLAMRALALQVLGREGDVKRAAEEAIRFTSRPLLGMHPADRRELLTGLYTSLGVNEACRGGGAALPYVQTLRELGSALGEATALRVRLIHHMQRGQWAHAEELRRELELRAIQGGATWQVQWFATPLEASMMLRAGDLVGAKRALSQLRALSQVRPSLGPLTRLVEVGLLYRRSELHAAAAMLPSLLAETPPRSRIGWSDLWGVAVANDCQLGEFERAMQRSKTALAAASPEDLQYVSLFGLLEVTRAWALAGLQHTEQARALIEDIHARRKALGDQVGLFELHNFRCFVAHQLGDEAMLEDSLARMVELGRELRSPGMLATAERTARWLGVLAHLSSRPPAARAAEPAPAQTEGDEDPITAVLARGPSGLVAAALADCDGAPQRARQALRILSERTDSARAYLYLGNGAGIRLAATLDGGEPPARIEQRVRTMLQASEPSPLAAWREHELGIDFDLRPLLDDGGGAEKAVGAFVHVPGDGQTLAPSPSLLRAVARELRRLGDVGTDFAFSCLRHAADESEHPKSVPPPQRRSGA